MSAAARATALKRICRTLAAAVDGLAFAAPVTHVYNPLVYARGAVERYLERAAAGRGQTLLLGMNPGPWGMAQTGVPFGAVSAVRDWLGIEGAVGKPPIEHPQRPVLGFAVEREEVSGLRFWGWAQRRFGTPERFFAHFFVANYCPLLFLEASGRNRTPDRLPAAERTALFAPCDAALRALVEVIEPARVVGVGVFAERRARSALAGLGLPIGRILHPSPASPAANRGWAGPAEEQLAALGVQLPA
ncbi:MAG: single-stranded DNA-binding protein [Gammaproteobacteria bacterium]